MKKRIIILLFFIFSFYAQAGFHPDAGGGSGGNTFPLSCVNFSGYWMSDDGIQYYISQEGCSEIKISWGTDSFMNSREIVPDGLERSHKSAECELMESHSWNSMDYGSSIQTNMTIHYIGHTVYQITTLEYVNASMLLENTYRITYLGKSNQPKREYKQRILRRKDSIKD